MKTKNTMRTLEDRIEYTLNKIRPYLMNEGGNIEIDHYDKETGILYVKMIGACAGCGLAPTDVSDSIAVILMNEIPQITAVELAGKGANPGFRSLQQQMMNPRTIAQQKADKEKK